ncbi:polyprenyl diphosphate synthase [Streptomyces sp. N50]|uniref:polyprenyl diphosphate synthase n=1 Tax=Streptomyces sp. N50 TaxID=3081765 RepID=UPI00296232DF|nr:polyprenyl diphosphate synthase [Streptomyces sp. N50]WOX11454.1 polyprenyl diphosphate synthase [Streptomyces sp. N50]
MVKFSPFPEKDVWHSLARKERKGMTGGLEVRRSKEDLSPAMPEILSDLLPRHVAIAPDGNGRWAEQRGLPRNAGHRQGGRALQDVIGGAVEIGVTFLSLHAFSTENWKRPASEVEDLMTVYADYLRENKLRLRDMGVRVRWLGSSERMPGHLVREIESAQEITQGNDALTFTLCINYGGRDEILHAVGRVAEDARSGALPDVHMDEVVFTRYLNRFALPDVDLFIRSGGEMRTSNFFLWQMAFSEMAFTEKPRPDMTREDLWEALAQYASRERRMGGLGRRGLKASGSARPTGDG